MKYVGSCVYLEPGGFWDYKTAPYLLSEHTDIEEAHKVYEYQKNRVYEDELEYFNKKESDDE